MSASSAIGDVLEVCEAAIALCRSVGCAQAMEPHIEDSHSILVEV
jgi:hypothetical protein